MSLRSRIIPSLLLSDGGLIKTKQFKYYKYLGDPINIIKIFNEKNVDELIIHDIDSTKKNLPINFDLLKSIANESNMPICYGGGIKDLDTAKILINMGFEKISISSKFLLNNDIIYHISKNIGSQSTVVTLDIKKDKEDNEYEIYSLGGEKRESKSLFKVIKIAENMGVGEIIINSIDRDGMREGYDLELAKKLKNLCNVPITMLGGAGNKKDIKKLLDLCSPIGAGVGSLFVFKGSLDAVLINYDSFIS